MKHVLVIGSGIRQRLLSGGVEESHTEQESQDSLCQALRKDLLQIALLHERLSCKDIDAGIHGASEQKLQKDIKHSRYLREAPAA